LIEQITDFHRKSVVVDNILEVIYGHIQFIFIELIPAKSAVELG